MIDEINDLSISQPSQSKIQEVLDKIALNKLIENQTSERDKARLLSPSLPQSEAWLSAAPILALGLHLLPKEFRAAVRYRLGATIYEKQRRCPYCKKGSVDTLGHHAFACHGRGDRISRHDRLRFSACSAANLSPFCEQISLIP